MEDLVSDPGKSWNGRAVFVTGHTGFKGGWLTLFLEALQSAVHGYSLGPPTTPSFFEDAAVGDSLASNVRADVLDFQSVLNAMRAAKPEVIFHLAAQSLVSEGYANPLSTVATNIVGTANILEAARYVDSIRAIVVVTTDKVYANSTSGVPQTEDDALGGNDPYSSSKAAAELITSSFRRSYFSTASDTGARIATARAGNVIGGGDWAKGRLIPDCIRAFTSGEPVRLRYPHATRPWQDASDVILGYLKLAESLLSNDGGNFARSWNFGPDLSACATVGSVAKTAAAVWGPGAAVETNPDVVRIPETVELRIDSTQARTLLGWSPRLSLDASVAEAVGWYRSREAGEDVAGRSRTKVRSALEGTPG